MKNKRLKTRISHEPRRTKLATESLKRRKRKEEEVEIKRRKGSPNNQLKKTISSAG